MQLLTGLQTSRSKRKLCLTVRPPNCDLITTTVMCHLKVTEPGGDCLTQPKEMALFRSAH